MHLCFFSIALWSFWLFLHQLLRRFLMHTKSPSGIKRMRPNSCLAISLKSDQRMQIFSLTFFFYSLLNPRLFYCQRSKVNCSNFSRGRKNELVKDEKCIPIWNKNGWKKCEKGHIQEKYPRIQLKWGLLRQHKIRRFNHVESEGQNITNMREESSTFWVSHEERQMTTRCKHPIFRQFFIKYEKHGGAFILYKFLLFNTKYSE